VLLSGLPLVLMVGRARLAWLSPISIAVGSDGINRNESASLLTQECGRVLYLPDPYPTRRGVTPLLRSSYLFPPLEPILHPEAKRLRRIEAADYGRKTLYAPTAIHLCIDKNVMFSK
jgi:hypothetical protein